MLNYKIRANASTMSFTFTAQLLKCWDDRLTLVGESYIEEYRSVGLALVLDLKIALHVDRNLAGGVQEMLKALLGSCFLVLKADTANRDKMGHWDDESMLIHNVQPVESRDIVIPALIGLYCDEHQVPNTVEGRAI